MTSELVYHKSPVVRTTVSRILAYTVDRMGIQKALTGGKDTTDKLLPAIAKLAQDGSPDARNYAKSSLQKMLTEHPDFEKILKKNNCDNEQVPNSAEPKSPTSQQSLEEERCSCSLSSAPQLAWPD